MSPSAYPENDDPSLSQNCAKEMTPIQGSNIPSGHRGKPREMSTGYRTRQMPRATGLPSEIARGRLLSVIQERMLPVVCCLNRLRLLVPWLLSGVAMMIALPRGERKGKPKRVRLLPSSMSEQRRRLKRPPSRRPEAPHACLPLACHAPGCCPLSVSLPPSHLAPTECPSL